MLGHISSAAEVNWAPSEGRLLAFVRTAYHGTWPTEEIMQIVQFAMQNALVASWTLECEDQARSLGSLSASVE